MKQIISADAARAYLHISKRKFLYMLQNGYIDYEDNGNKTHRYSLKMSDVEALRKAMNEHPERFADLSGRFTAQKSTPTPPHIVLSPGEAKALREYLEKRWRHHPDAMPSKLASELTGITVGTLNRHVAKETLIGAVIGGKMFISKQSLIGHLTSLEVALKVGTEQLRKLIVGCKKAEK